MDKNTSSPVKRNKEVNITAIVIYATDCDKKLFEKTKKSVEWCDELVLINGVKGSFSHWRSEGLKKAKGDWILYIDSDEEVSSELRSEMVKWLDGSKVNKYSAFAVPRKNIIFGKEFKHSGQYPDYQIRFFKKDKLKKWVGDLHESPEYIGKLGYLKNSLIHHKDISISEMLEKTNKWSEIEGKLLFESNHPPMNFLRFLSAGLREFWKRFILEKAFLDGREGVIYGIYQIYSRLISYSKLWEKQQSTIHI